MTQRNTGPFAPNADKVMAEYIAEVEANSDRRAFDGSKWPLMDSDLQVAQLAHLLGVGCEFYIYQLDSGKVITTYCGNGPWPYASVQWVWGEPCWYEEALIRVALDNALEGGGWKNRDLREMTTRVVDELVPTKNTVLGAMQTDDLVLMDDMSEEEKR